MKVVAYARRWFIDGEKAAKVRNENGRLTWPFKFKLLEITQLNALPDDEPLVTLAEAEAAVKQAREDALEEAKQLFPQPHCEYFGREIQAAIESLKGKP